VGRLHVVFGGSTQLPLTHVVNCADLFATAAENTRAIGETFNAIDDDEVRAWGYLGEYLKHSADHGVRIALPYGLALAGVRLARWSSRRIFQGKGKLPSLLVPCRFEARFKPLRFSNWKAREILGWRPPMSFAECLRLTYEEPVSGPAASAAAPNSELAPADV
jgi:UDP-glucose 4-epimerase